MTRLRRAVLVVPATSWPKLEKAAGLDVDEVVIDLEDAVPASLKTDQTRRQAADVIARLAWRAPTLAVRVNAFGTPWFEDDIAEIVEHGGQRLDCIVLPKVELAEAVTAAVSAIDAARPGAGIGVEALIESALGVVRVESIARRPRRASRPSSSEPETTRPRWASRWPASVPSSPPIPAISGRIRGPDRGGRPRLRARCDRRAVRRLAGSRWPGRVGSARPGARLRREVGDPPGSDRDVHGRVQLDCGRAGGTEQTLADLDAAGRTGDGVAVSGGSMVDEASRRQAARTLERARRAAD